jgi:hypothetical protein
MNVYWPLPEVTKIQGVLLGSIGSHCTWLSLRAHDASPSKIFRLGKVSREDDVYIGKRKTRGDSFQTRIKIGMRASGATSRPSTITVAP